VSDEDLYLIHNVDRLPNVNGPRRGEIEPYYTDLTDGLPIAVRRDAIPQWEDRLVPVPPGMAVSTAIQDEIDALDAKANS
jgi:hypothetical protein